MSVKSPIKRHGGKAYLAKKIVEMMPPHTRYCEPYFGSGAVLFAKPFEGVSEAVNDLDRWLSNFWEVLKHEHLFEKFQRICDCTPLSEKEFDVSKSLKCLMWHGDIPDEGRILRAHAFFVRNRQSRQALEKCYCTPTSRTRRGMNEQVSAWLSAVEGLPEAHARLKRVEVRCKDAIEFIQEYDSEETFFYADPPYPSDTRTAKKSYDCEMTTADHESLLQTLGSIKGKFILSSYPNQQYSQHGELNGWRCEEVEIDNKASSKKSKDKETEVLWLNY